MKKRAILIIVSLLATLIAVTMSACFAANKDVEALKTQYAAIETKITSLESEKAEMEAELEELRNAMSASTYNEVLDLIEDFDGQFEIVNSDMQDLQSGLLSAKARLNILESDTADIPQLQSDLNALDAKVVAASLKVDKLTTDLSALTDRVVTLEAKVLIIETALNGDTGLIAKVAKLEGERAQLQQDLDSAEARLDALDTAGTGEIALIKGRLSTVEGTISTINTDISTLKSLMGTSGKSIDDILSSVSDINIRLTTAEGDISTISSTVSGLTTKVTKIENALNGDTGLIAKVGTLEAQRLQLQEDLDTAEARLDALDTAKTGEIALLKGRLTSVESTINEINTAISDLNSLMGISGTSIDDIVSAVSDIDGRLTDVEGDISTISTTLGSLDSRITTIETALNGSTGLIAKVTKLEGERAQLQQDLDAAEARLDTLDTAGTGEIALIKNRLNTVEGTISTINADISALKGLMGTSGTSIDDILSSISDIDGRLTDVEGDISTINTTITDLDERIGEIELLLATYEIMESNVGILLESKQALESQLSTLESKVNSMETAGEALAEELEQEKAKIVSLQNNVKSLESQINSANKQIEKLKADTLSLSSDINALKASALNAQNSIALINNNISLINNSISLLDQRVTQLENKFKEIEEADAYAAALAAKIMDDWYTTFANNSISAETFVLIRYKANYYSFYILRSQSKAIADERYNAALADLKTTVDDITAYYWKYNQLFASLNALDYSSANWVAIGNLKTTYEAVWTSATEIEDLPDYETIVAAVAQVQRGWAAYVGASATVGTRYLTIQNAIDAATAGSTVMIKSGTHLLTAALSVGKDLTLKADGNVILRGGLGAFIFVSHYASPNNITIDGIIFESTIPGTTDYGFIVISAMAGMTTANTPPLNVTVQNCTITGKTLVGTETQQMTGITTSARPNVSLIVKNNTFNNLKYAMYFNGIANLDVTGNTISNTRYGGIIIDSYISANANNSIIIKDNILLDINNANNGYYDELYASGIAFANTRPAGTTATISGNTIIMNLSDGAIGICDVTGDITTSTALSKANGNCTVRCGNDYYNITTQRAFEEAMSIAKTVSGMTVVLGEGEFHVNAGMVGAGNTINITGDFTLTGAGASKTEIFFESISYGFNFTNGNISISGIMLYSTSNGLGTQGSLITTTAADVNISGCDFYIGRNGVTLNGGTAELNECNFYAHESKDILHAVAINLLQVNNYCDVLVTDSNFIGGVWSSVPGSYIYGALIYSSKVVFDGCTFKDLKEGMEVLQTGINPFTLQTLRPMLNSNTFTNVIMDIWYESASLNYTRVATTAGLLIAQAYQSDGLIIDLVKGEYLLNAGLEIKRGIILNGNGATFKMAAAADVFAVLAYPVYDAGNVRTVNAIIGINTGANPVIDNLTIDGNNFSYQTGVCVIGGGTAELSRLTIKNLHDNINNSDRGYGIIVDGGSQANVTLSNISGFAKGGAYCLIGTLNISDTVITGNGKTFSSLQNGIWYFEGAGGTLSNVTIENMQFNTPTPYNYSSGLYIELNTSVTYTAKNLTFNNMDVDIIDINKKFAQTPTVNGLKAILAEGITDVTIKLSGTNRYNLTDKITINGNVTLLGMGVEITEIYSANNSLGLVFAGGDVVISGIKFTTYLDGVLGSEVDFNNRDSNAYNLTITDCDFYAGKNGLTIRGGTATVERCNFYAWDASLSANPISINLMQVDFLVEASVIDCNFHGAPLSNASGSYVYAMLIIRGGHLSHVEGSTFNDLTTGVYIDNSFDSGALITPINAADMAAYKANNNIYTNNASDINGNCKVTTEAELISAIDSLPLEITNINITDDITLSDAVSVGRTLTITGITDTANRTITAAADTRHFTVTDGGVLTLSEITLTGNDLGGGIYVEDGGTLILEDGAIITNCTADFGGGVYVEDGGSLILNGGEIINNQATGGGGVYLAAGITTFNFFTFNVPSPAFVMNNGTIQNNTASGGGVYVAGGSFEMTGGTIKDNMAGADGSGIFGESGSTVEISGGEISGTDNNLFGGDIISDMATVTFVLDETTVRYAAIPKGTAVSKPETDNFILWYNQETMSFYNFTDAINSDMILIPAAFDPRTGSIAYNADKTITIGVAGNDGPSTSLGKIIPWNNEGFTVTIQIYLNPQTHTGTFGFDITMRSALGNYSTERRIAFAKQTTGVNAGKLTVGLAHQPVGTPYVVKQAEWFTAGISYYDNDEGRMHCKMFLLDESGTEIASWTHTDLSKDNGASIPYYNGTTEEIGAPGALWFLGNSSPVIVKNITVVLN